MVHKILLFLFGSAISIMADCSEKITGDVGHGNVCDSIAARNPWDRMIFSITMARTPGDHYDSAHMAVLKVNSEALFSKYDLRSSSDTAVPIKPPLEEIDYGYDYLLIRAETLDSIAQEPYVVQLAFRSKLPTTRLFGNPPVGLPASKARVFFNANGVRSEISTAPRFWWQK